MYVTRGDFYVMNIIITLIVSYEFVKCDISRRRSKDNSEEKYEEAVSIAQATTLAFMDLFDGCMETTLYDEHFGDSLQKYVLWPPRTTVGLAPKYTANRKFFANLLSTTAFKDMLRKDEDQLRIKFGEKMKYCDNAIMDPALLRDFYDREVDQSKLKK